MDATSRWELKRGSYECFILAVSLLSLTNLTLALALTPPGTGEILQVCDVVLSGILLLDFGVRLISAPSRRGYLIRQFGWLDLLGSLPYPGLRLARFFRIVRVIRLLRDDGLRRLRRGIVRDRSGSTLLGILFMTLVLIEAGSLLIYEIEVRARSSNIQTPYDALWWTYVTIATVGYGDRYPVTNAGRVVGVVTMTVGVVLYGAITAFLADAFIRPPANQGDRSGADTDDLRAELHGDPARAAGTAGRGHGATARAAGSARRWRRPHAPTERRSLGRIIHRPGADTRPADWLLQASARMSKSQGSVTRFGAEHLYYTGERIGRVATTGGAVMARMRFGIFMAPFHAPTGQNPTAAYARDLATIQLLDELGYDEAWIGEHHSGGVELIPSPEIFIAHAAAQTRHIKLGAGVISLPYHNPLWVADRMILLDHLTRGRSMMGVGPGALPTDATMIGIDPLEQRAALEEDFEVLMHLLLSDEPISVETKRYRLVNARSQYRPYTDPCFEIGVAAIASPSGPRLAGRYGVGLLSVGATINEAFDALHLHWDVMEERAAEFGTVADRSKWRLVGPMHLAESKEQAIRDVRHGLDAFCDYTQHTIAAPHFRAAGATFEERVAWVNETGLGVIGTPDEAMSQIERLVEQSGGFGCYLMMAHEWADPEATRRSYELFARYVMPRFQSSATRLQASERWSASVQAGLDVRQAQALKEWTDKHAAERAARQSIVGH